MGLSDENFIGNWRVSVETQFSRTGFPEEEKYMFCHFRTVLVVSGANDGLEDILVSRFWYIRLSKTIHMLNNVFKIHMVTPHFFVFEAGIIQNGFKLLLG